MFILAPQELPHYSSLWNKTFTTGKVSASFDPRSGGPSSLFQKRKKKWRRPFLLRVFDSFWGLTLLVLYLTKWLINWFKQPLQNLNWSKENDDQGTWLKPFPSKVYWRCIYFNAISVYGFLIGFVYGAKKGKVLNMFIDDLSLPRTDEFGTQEVNEVSTLLLQIYTSLAHIP